MAGTRYFFAVIDGKLMVDEEWTLCSSWDEMRLQAIAMAGACLKGLASSYPGGLEWQMVVTNEAKETSDAVFADRAGHSFFGRVNWRHLAFP